MFVIRIVCCLFLFSVWGLVCGFSRSLLAGLTCFRPFTLHSFFFCFLRSFVQALSWVELVTFPSKKKIYTLSFSFTFFFTPKASSEEGKNFSNRARFMCTAMLRLFFRFVSLPHSFCFFFVLPPLCALFSF